MDDEKIISISKCKSNVKSDVESRIMKTAVCTAPEMYRIENNVVRSPDRNEVVVKIEGCGICASNLPVWEGRPWFDYPLEQGAPGHEGWGRIIEIGDNVSDVRVGDRVTLLSDHSFSEFETVKKIDIVKLPEKLENAPFPGEPLGCVMNVFKRSDIQEGQTVAVIGCGFLGLMLIQLLAREKVETIAVSSRKWSLDMATQFGADHVIQMTSEWGVISKVKDLTKGNMCERVIEATGYQPALNIATEIVSVRGKLIIAGYHQDGPRSVNMQQWNWKGIDVINAHERDSSVYRQGVKEAIDAIMDRRIQINSLLTHSFTLDEINLAFNMLKKHPEGFIKGMVLL